MMLETKNLTKFFGPRQALESVSFVIGKGVTAGLLGVDGSGKSTVMRILAGFFAPTHGEALVDGRDPRLAATRRNIGYMPESNALPTHMRVEEYLIFRAGLKGVTGAKARGAVAETGERCGVGEVMDRLIGRLPRGIRRRVGLADSLLAGPEALILDEPMTGLDARQAAEMRELIADVGEEVTVLLSSSVLADIEGVCERMIILDQGKVVADDSPERLCERTIEERVIHMEVISSEPVREAFRAVPGVRTVSVHANPKDVETLGVRVTVPAGVDLRRELSGVCSQRGWLVTEMRMEPVRLEDIFRRLTGNR